MLGVLSAIVPVFLVAAMGGLARRTTYLDAKTLSALNVYLLIPALVFSSLSRQVLEWSLFGRYAVATVAMYAVTLAVLGGVARQRGLSGAYLSAFLMTAFVNLGNFGLPVTKFAFGDTGLALAVIVMVCGSLLQNTLGLYFAHRGSQPAREAFRQVFRYPIIYALALALVFQRTGWRLPAMVGNAIDLTGDAAIPVQLLVLGIKLAETRLDAGADVFLATAVRLALGPVLALAIAWGVGLHGLSRDIFIVMMSGPVAVGMAAFGVQFDVHPRFLASVVSWSFLFSLLTVTLVLYFLMPAA